jgi:hypothetical protein
MYNYPANETRFQPVNAQSVTTWFKSLQKWISGGRASRHCPFTDSTQAHDLIEEMQRPLILNPHCIAISAMLGRPYLGRSGHESA